MKESEHVKLSSFNYQNIQSIKTLNNTMKVSERFSMF